MIVQPDFPEHWKTRLLVELTGDESAPMAVLRLWAHCQHSRRSKFPDMTPAQLASLCHWGKRKPSCHVALARAGFVEKLSPKGFAAHEWDQHNAQLLQKWQAGQKGGRPSSDACNSSDNQTEKPTDNRPRTGTKPDRPDQTRPDQIREDQTREDQTRSDKNDPTRPDAGASVESKPSGTPTASATDGQLPSGNGMDGTDGIGRMVAGIASKMRTPGCSPPSFAIVHNHLKHFFKGAEQFAQAFYNTMEEQKWRDKKGEPISSWQKMSESYASKAALSQKA
jgi:hypothetical protein